MVPERGTCLGRLHGWRWPWARRRAPLPLEVDRPQSLFYFVPQENLTAKQDWLTRSRTKSNVFSSLYFHGLQVSQGLNESWVFRCHELHSFGLQIIFICISIATWTKVANDQKGTLYQNLPCWDLQKRFKSHRFTDSSCSICHISESTGCFFSSLVPPKKLKYGKPRLGESTLT